MSLGRPGRIQRSGTRAWLLRSLAVLALACPVPGCLPDQRDIPLDAGAAKIDIQALDSMSDTGAVDAADAASEDVAEVEPVDTSAPDVVVLPLGCATETDCKDVQAPMCQRVACDGPTGLCVLAGLDDGAACTGDACTDPGTCVGGNCTGALKNCDDGNDCTGDGCHPLLGCSHSPVAAPCSDGNGCTDDVCSGGVCKNKVIGCADQGPCTVGTCNPISGQCKYVAVADAAKIACTVTNVQCGGAGICTGGSCCADGKCPPPGQVKVCDDGNPCTQDSCPGPGYGAKDCLHFTMLGAACKIGCDPGSCGEVGGKAECQNVVSVKSSNQCVIAKCDPLVAQWDYTEHKADGTPCTDSPNACVTNTVCKKGVCDAKSGTPLTCFDANPCTLDKCEASGCTYKPADAACSDGNACTSGDACSNGVCAGTPVACDDANPCTTDACAPVSGCSHVALVEGADCGAGKSCQTGACLVKP